ncbi:MAG: TraR/DksA C4-type zinc finger protein [Chloroflexi bacterium]|nr:TraR/DksA C4-type zinc finger protein [Chloroflexota bacterium]
MLDSADLALFREQLHAEQARLTRSIRALESEVEQLAASEDEEGGGAGNDPADVGTDVYEQERALTLERNEMRLLHAVEEALARIDAGTYGACARCGRPIGMERLEALPHAALCITCQAEVERHPPRPAARRH